MDRIQVLKSELLADPSGLGYAANLPEAPGLVVDQLNALTEARPGRVERPDFAIWCAGTGMRAVIQDHAENAASPLRSVALTLIDFLRGSATAIDFSLPGNVASLQAFVSAGACQQDQANSLLAMSETKISRAEKLGIAPVSEADIREALEQ